LNVEESIPGSEINRSYTHIAFSIDSAKFDRFEEKLQLLDVNMLNGCQRSVQDKQSLYFTDPDGHKFEFHTGSLQDRLNYYSRRNRL